MFHIGMDDFRGIAEEVLRKGNNLSFIAGGSSMSPFIKDGDTVVVQPAQSLHIGDTTLCKAPEGRLILHRVVKVTTSGVVTRGDACLTDDGFTSIENTLGRVVRVSGRGFNFHLRFPFSILIARGLLRPSRFSRHVFLFSLAKRLASLLG
ncbi:MAG: S24/S26 family peptidase [Nitrospiraceae bacterium]|nr:S24/S26 family peptidase [Nitrospiraceae bacterium]